jgi:hypothetical protein
MRPAAPRAARPVFVDRSGRRRRLVLAVGLGLAGLFSAALVLLVVGMSGASGLHVPGFPDANGAQATGKAPSTTPSSGQGRPQTQAGPAAPAASAGTATPGNIAPESASASASPTSSRRTPTQTPSHPAKT